MSAREKFVAWMADTLGGDPKLAETVLSDFLRQENIRFGDSRYDWSVDGAIDLAKSERGYWP